MNQRLPPHDIDAEASVIGSLLIGGDFTLCNLVPEDFYHEPLRWMYACCQSLVDRSVSINQITLAQELDQKKQLDSVGGAAYLSHLIAECPTPYDIAYYADIVRRLSAYRKLIGIGNDIQRLAYDSPPDLADSMAKADDMLLGLRKQTSQLTIVPPKERMRRLADRYAELYKAEGGIAIKTGLRSLDMELGGGFYGGDLIVVGGRPGMGKSQIVQGMANYVSLTHNVLFCSSEMSIESLGDRDVAGLLGIRVQTVRLGGYPDEMFATITGPVLEEMEKRQIFYCDDIPLTTAKITQAAISCKLRYNIGMVVVDYLGQLADQEGQNENVRIGGMTRKLKALARMLSVPVIVVHQLNRALEQRNVKEKRPMLSDLRDSGSVEQDADVVLMLYRDSYYRQLTDFERTFLAQFGDGKVSWEQAPEELRDYWVTEILIRKHRQGDSNIAVKVFFDRKHQTYRDLARTEEIAEGE